MEITSNNCETICRMKTLMIYECCNARDVFTLSQCLNLQAYSYTLQSIGQWVSDLLLHFTEAIKIFAVMEDRRKKNNNFDIWKTPFFFFLVNYCCIQFLFTVNITICFFYFNMKILCLYAQYIYNIYALAK